MGNKQSSKAKAQTKDTSDSTPAATTGTTTTSNNTTMSNVEDVQVLKAEIASLKAKLAAATEAASAPPAPSSTTTPSSVTPSNGETKSAAPDSNPEEIRLRSDIDACAKTISTLKSKGAPSDEWLPMVTTLKQLRADYETKIGKPFSSGGKKKKSKGKSGKYVPKTPLGMVDHDPKEMALREAVMSRIKEIFKRHGAVQIETPVAELKQTLMGKYGEDSKLIYDLADQGGELLALRYDLTVPFARYCAEHGVKSIKRYHIARVYRRDNPVISKGRFREFYQCDIDIRTEPRTYVPMLPDAECIKICCEILTELELGDFIVKINNRKILDGMFEVCGVPEEKFRPICSAVDKLDKMSWEDVRKEMVDDKGLAPEAADRIHKYVVVKSRGGEETLQMLQNDELMMNNKRAREGIDEMAALLQFCRNFKCSNNVSFDLSLARGLDYYTGVIYEAVMIGQDVGSVAGGGRYDYLVSMFSKKKKSPAPCVGVSIGIERLFAIVKRKIDEDKAATSFSTIRENPCDILVVSAGKKLVDARMAICGELWGNGLRCEMIQKSNPKILNQFQHAEKHLIPWIVVIGDQELSDGIVKVRHTQRKEEVIVQREQMVSHLKALIHESTKSAEANGETKSEEVNVVNNAETVDVKNIPLGHTNYSWCPPGIVARGATTANTSSQKTTASTNTWSNRNTPLLCGGGEKDMDAKGLKVESNDGRMAFSRPL